MLAFSDAPAPLVSYFALASGLATYVSAYGYTTVRYATGPYILGLLMGMLFDLSMKLLPSELSIVVAAVGG